MRVFLLILFAAQSALAVPLNSARFIHMYDDDGHMQLVDLEEKANMDLVNEVTRDPANNQYFLYTRLNPTSSQTLVFNNANSVTSSNFNAARQTIVIVHGWSSNRNSALNPGIRDVYLAKLDVNVIVMDWSALAGQTYVTAKAGTAAVGRGLGQFLAFLNSVTGAAYTNMHLIGFSLGAHIVGNAGREVGGRIVRITGLDPAGPLWLTDSNRLGPNDGIYVEAIHTNGGILPNLGIGMAVANADFFPNGGTVQPGCSILQVNCSHSRSWQLFVATVSHNHLIGRRCDNMNQVNSNSCTGEMLNMGTDNLNKIGNGLFRLNTGSSHPF